MAEQFPGEFRLGDEEPDIIDRGFGVFVGDPRLRRRIDDEGLTSIAQVEAAADEQARLDAQVMGVAYTQPAHLDDILARYEAEFRED